VARLEKKVRDVDSDWQKQLMKKLMVLLLVLAVAAVGYLFYKSAGTPVIADIPPKENADGTVDYTLLWVQKANNASQKDTITEWVFRLPKSYEIRVSKPVSVEVNNGMNFNIQSNSFISFDLDPVTLAPIPLHQIEGNSFNSRADWDVSVQIGPAYPRSADEKRTTEWKDQCVPTGNKIGGLVEYARPNKGYTKCRAGSKQNLFYALASDDTEKSIDCPSEFPSCSYSFWHGNLRIYGDIGKSRLDRFKAFASFIEHTLDTAKISERTVELSQYQHQH
jgi:hypothetical protein